MRRKTTQVDTLIGSKRKCCGKITGGRAYSANIIAIVPNFGKNNVGTRKGHRIGIKSQHRMVAVNIIIERRIKYGSLIIIARANFVVYLIRDINVSTSISC